MNTDIEAMIERGELMIFLLWPSWIGKTFWSKAIMNKYQNFLHVDIDANVWRSKGMKDLIKSVSWEDEVRKMWNFFWTPWTFPEVYKKKEAIYLWIEKIEMNNFYESLNSYSENIIADFTGSSVYCVEEIEKFKWKGIFVYFEAWKEAYTQMQDNFLADPKPVVWWEELLNKWIAEYKKSWIDSKEQLPNLYKDLLDYRAKHYLKHADVVLSWSEHRWLLNPEKPEQFFELIQKKLNY